jgi:hypothetical protein
MEDAGGSANSFTVTTIAEDFARRPFALSGEHLRKLVAIMCRRMPSDARLSVEVKRVDGWTFRTDNIEQLLSDDRISDEPVARIEIRYLTGGLLDRSAFKVELKFESEPYWRPIDLNLSGPDYDAIHLLASDLRRFIQSNLLLRVPSGWLVSLSLLCVTLLLLALLPKSPRPALPDVQAALNNPDLQAKLNYLIQLTAHGRQSGAPGMSSVGVILVILCSVYYALADNPVGLRHLYPKNVFLFGSELMRYQSVLRLRRNLFWGFIMAVVASVIAGFILLRIGH